MSWQQPALGQGYPPQPGYPPQQGYPPQGQPHPGYPKQQPVYVAPQPNHPSPMMNNTTIVNNTPARGLMDLPGP